MLQTIPLIKTQPQKIALFANIYFFIHNTPTFTDKKKCQKPKSPQVKPISLCLGYTQVYSASKRVQ